MHYTIHKVSNGLCVSEYDADEPVPPFRIEEVFMGDEYETRDANGNVVPTVNLRRVWTKAEFKRRMTAAERIAARTLAKTQPAIEDFIDILDSSGEVRSDDPDVPLGLGALEAFGVLASGRANEILYGD